MNFCFFLIIFVESSVQLCFFSMADTGSGDSQTRSVGSMDTGSFQLGNNDQPRITILTAPFTGTNYLMWSTVIQISLKAKDKLGFIEGSITKPTESSSEFSKWRKADYMVRSWILGSLTKELDEVFVYCSIGRILWEELKERFGESNGPQVYKVQREITSIQQGNSNLATYFNKLKRLWEDLNKLPPLPYCECGGFKCGITKKLTHQLRQFSS